MVRPKSKSTRKNCNASKATRDLQKDSSSIEQEIIIPEKIRATSFISKNGSTSTKHETPPGYRLDNWSYPTVVEPPDAGHDFLLHERVISINGMPFQKRSDCKYKFDYYALMDEIEELESWTPEQRKAEPLRNEINFYRNYCQDDLWFFVYFVMKNPLANHPFIVNACREIEEETGNTLEVWARDHLKTTIISAGRQIQKVLNDPERRVAILSAVRPLAVKIQNLIKRVLESKFLVQCFPDILYVDARKEAEKWTEAPEGGLIVKRQGFYKEPTFGSFGLIEGMPTGDHYTDIVCDDIINQDLQSPEIMERVCENFILLESIATRDAQTTVVGTYYRNDDPLIFIGNLTDPESGKKLFKIRKRPATHDGTRKGRSVFLPEKKLARLRAGKPYLFACQQLLNPTPKGDEKLNPDDLIKVSKRDLPQNLYRFMLIDGSGDKGRRQDREADPWAFVVIGVNPFIDDTGLSDIYILDLVIKRMDLATAQRTAVDVYCRNGRILKLGVEKVGASTTEIHICNALKARRKFVSLERKNLEILRPGSRSKEYRIESSLAWPLKNGKIHYLDTIEEESVQHLKTEMEKFPAWHEDGLDALSYGYDIIKAYRFGRQDSDEEEKKSDRWDDAFERAKVMNAGRGFMSV